MIAEIGGHFSRQSKVAIMSTGVAFTLLIGLFDYSIGNQISPTLFYFFPVFFVTWFAGNRAGIAIAFFSVAVSLGVDLHPSQTRPLFHPLSPYFNAMLRLGILLVTVFLLSTVKKQQERLEQDVADKTASLLKTVETLRKVIQTSPLPIIMLDKVGNVLQWSPAAESLFGWGSEEVLSRPLPIVPAEQQEAFQALLANQLNGATYTAVDLCCIKKDRSLVDVNLWGAPLKDASGNITGTMQILADVTERKRAGDEIRMLNANLALRADELEAVNHELEAFSYSVSHDLRKPLTIINGYCQAILELYSGALDTTCEKYIGEIYEGTLRMNQLIDALLKFSVMVRGELHREPVDLSGMAGKVAAELRLMETGRNVTFNIAEGITVNGDRNLLRVVMENLLGNAWKYTGTQEEAVIEFGTTEINGKHACFVRDNGAGFDMAQADKLFIPFQRLPGAAGFQGSGIGLATVKRIIERHGGEIWAEGKIGKGATFYFSV